MGSLLRIAILLIILVIFLRIFVISPGQINGYSMLPSYQDGQFFLINKVGLLFFPPTRGQVIQYFYPETKQFNVKRIIGTPGDTVIIENGQVSIKNSEGEITQLVENYIAPSSEETKQTENGVYGPLADNEYFVMGDNREQSSDSRQNGPTHRSEITGLVIF